MYIDGINLAEGSVVNNLTVASGADFPSTPTLGELFYVDAPTNVAIGLYLYNGAAWVSVASNGSNQGGEGGVTAFDLAGISYVISTEDINVPNAIVLTSIGSGFLKNDAATGALSTASSIDLGTDVSGTLDASHLPTSGVTAGSFNKVSVDNKGRVISATQETTLAGLGITDTFAAVNGNSTQNFNVQQMTVSGDILPTTNGVQNIGSPTLRWSTIYVNEAKLSTNTLYIGETAILGTTADTIKIKADPGQSIHMLTQTTGSTLITSENQVQISTSGMNADVIIQATGSGAKVRLGATDSVQFVAPTTSVTGDFTTSGNGTIGGNLTVNGNLNINGTQTIVNSTTVTTKDNIILVNYGELGSGVTSGKAGIQVDRGDLADYQIIFDETDDLFKVGQVGDLEIIASRPWVSTNTTPASHTGAGGSAHAVATTSVAGFMSAADKLKLDGISGTGSYTHPDSGVTAGTYTKVTVNAQGHVTVGSALSASDVPAIDWAKITSGTPTSISGYGITDAYTKTETDSRIQAVVGAAPAALDTLKEIADQLASDESAVAALTLSVSGKLNSSEVVSSPAANKVLRLDVNGKLPTDITGNATTATSATTASNVAWSGVSGTPTTILGYGITDAQPLDGDLSAIAALVGTSGILKKTAANTWTLDTSSYITGNQNISVTGDATGSGTTTIALTLANSGVTAGTYNDSATQVSPFTVDAKGRITSVGTAVTIAPAWTSISGKPTTLAGYGITDAVGSSHTSDYTMHLNSAQNTWLDAITATSSEVNFLSGVTGNVQAQINTKQASLGFTPENTANKGIANGYAGLDSSGKVPAAQLPSYVDDVLEYATFTGFPVTGSSGIIYVAQDTNKIFRWSGSAYVEISPTAGNADTATKLATSRTITLSGDVSGSVSFDGSSDVTITTAIGANSLVLGTDTTGNYVATIAAGTAGAQSGTSGLTISATAGEGTAATIALSNTGVTAGTYSMLTVDAQGRVTAASTPTTLSGYGITDAQATLVSGTNVKTVNGASILGSGNIDLGGAVTGILKVNGAGAYSAAVAGTDYVVPAGNTATSTKLATSRSITASGDASWTVNFDGSTNVSAALTLANSGVTAGTYNNSATQVTPFTVDAKGRITATGTAVTIAPAWSSITGKPTTVSGYGITDVYVKTEVYTKAEIDALVVDGGSY
jgi:phage-related tail fiber protein